MAIKNFHDIFTEVGNAKGRAEKVKVLQKYSSSSLKAVLGFTYDPGVIWMLPETDPPFKKFDPEVDGEPLRLASETRKFYLFVKGYSPAQKDITQAKREQVFLNLLETLHPEEAQVLLDMKNRRLQYNGLTAKLVAEAFPNIAKNW
jgi:hypothetical protein